MAPFISSPELKLIAGLLIGIIFGFSIQKSRMTRYETIVGQLRLKDFTMIKVMLTAIIVGMIGIYFFRDIGILTLKPKSTYVGANILGGLIFGIGFAIAGYCPTTGIGAVSEGRFDALFGAIPGMLAGAGIYAKAYSSLKDSLFKLGSYGKITLPDIAGLSAPFHWILIFIICAAIIFFLKFLQKRGL
ncbi:MAG: DUF6691 family protein [Spirochaetota bacterium]